MEGISKGRQAVAGAALTVVVALGIGYLMFGPDAGKTGGDSAGVGSAGVGSAGVGSTLFVLSEADTALTGSVEKLEGGSGKPAYLIKSTEHVGARDEQQNNAYITLGPEIEEAVSGRRVRVDFTVREPEENRSPRLSIVYFTMGVGNSGWQQFKIESEAKSHSFEYDVPPMDGGPDRDIIVISADSEGRGRSVELEDLKVSVLPEEAE